MRIYTYTLASIPQQATNTAAVSPALTKQKTLSRYVEVETWKQRDLADLQPVMNGIESACRGISTLVRRAQCDEIAGLHGSGGDTNVQGEVQKVSYAHLFFLNVCSSE